MLTGNLILQIAEILDDLTDELEETAVGSNLDRIRNKISAIRKNILPSPSPLSAPSKAEMSEE